MPCPGPAAWCESGSGTVRWYSAQPGKDHQPRHDGDAAPADRRFLGRRLGDHRRPPGHRGALRARPPPLSTESAHSECCAISRARPEGRAIVGCTGAASQPSRLQPISERAGQECALGVISHTKRRPESDVRSPCPIWIRFVGTKRGDPCGGIVHRTTGAGRWRPCLDRAAWRSQ